MNKTNIEWVVNPDGSRPGWAWNVITGCLNHDNGLCKGGGFPCYAYKLAHGRLKQRYLANENIAPLMEGEEWIPMKDISDPFYPRFWEERLKGFGFPKDTYRQWNRKGIFVCDMGDLFGIGVPEHWTEMILDQINLASYHRFYLLTKQPQNLIKFSPFPENCWVGVTVTNADMYLPAMEVLDVIEAKVKYISFEPLLENPNDFCEQWSEDLGVLDWLIIGACTSQDHWELEAFNYHHGNNLKLARHDKRWTFQPKIEWVKEIVEAADKAGVKVFLKDNLKRLLPREVPTFYRLAEPWNDRDPKPVLRQEMPTGKND
jgi:protein gp37